MKTPAARLGDSRESALLHAALALPPAARAAFLDHACAAEPVLRQRLEHLLQAQENAPTLPPQAAVPGLTEEQRPTEVAPMAEEIAQRIGRYDWPPGGTITW